MITNIIEYDLKENDIVQFDEIDNDDINTKIILGSLPDGLYELSDKLRYENLELIQKKYNIDVEGIYDIWNPKINKMLEQFDLENLLKYIKYTKEIYIKLFGEEYGSKAYKNFLEGFIIGNDFWYEKFIITNKEFVNFLEGELRNIFKYYPDRGDKVGFAIDKLYGYIDPWNYEGLDNNGEITRYHYWRKYKEKGKSIIKK
ncbi:MAG: hypothetical protein Q8K30_00370 [Candidatus Gracilibacteria bacterium]|nr:hypothetical protein [Candidatus Gracilibacteria bacterium]